MKLSRLLLALGCGAFLVAAGYAMRGEHGPSGNTGYLGYDTAGVFGTSTTNSGILGFSFGDDSAGVAGLNLSADGVSGSGLTGVYGFSSAPAGTGLWGATSGTSPDAVGIYGFAPSTGWAGYFQGDLGISGTLVKAAGSFRIDHPLDPQNKYLSHSFVESPEMMNIYAGTTLLDGSGEATVELPQWFETLNRDFRYQLTCIGEHAPVYVAKEISGNQFKIAGGQGSIKVSWQVTGSRKDPYAIANPIPVESWKGPGERGRFLHPEAYGLTAAAGINAARDAKSRSRAMRMPASR